MATKKKIKLVYQEEQKTFEQVCELYLADCRQRNLRIGTINHYRQSYTQFYKFIPPETPISTFTEDYYNSIVEYLCSKLENSISVNAYLRDLITTLHFAINQGFVEPFKMRSIKVDKHPIETYTEEELTKLLRKPNMKTCSFSEYKSWVMTSFLFSTGVRQHTLHEIQIRDLDLANRTCTLRVTKNRKVLIIPLNKTITEILEEYLKHRAAKEDTDFLFCNQFGEKLVKSTSYHILAEYNKSRGVAKTGIHRYRHTFAKYWIVNGGSVAVLSSLLGHSSLDITQNYINLLVTDLSKSVDELNVLENFQQKQRISLKK